jgi:excisionase family DNA binding protein
MVMSEARVETAKVVYTPREVAALLGCSLPTVYRHMRKGFLPVVQLPGGRMWVNKAKFNAMFHLSA